MRCPVGVGEFPNGASSRVGEPAGLKQDGAVTAKAAKLLEVGYLDSHSSPVFVAQILSTEGVANCDCAGGVV
jgi:hypothetical protein